MKLKRLPPGLARSHASKAIQRRAGASERGCFEGVGVLVSGLDLVEAITKPAENINYLKQTLRESDSSLPDKVFLKLRRQTIWRQHLTTRFIAVRCESRESECEVPRHTQGGPPPSPVTRALYAPASPRNNPARN